MKINLNHPLMGLDGVPSPDQVQGKILAACLANSPTGDPLKFWGWALKLHKGEEFEIDEADYEVLQKFVKDCPALTIAGKAQLLQSLTKCKNGS